MQMGKTSILFNGLGRCWAVALLGVFCLTAPATGAAFRDIYTFQGQTDGQLPTSGLIADAQGRLYGVTSEGGQFGYGTVFRLTPPVGGIGQWTDEILHSFALSDGVPPSGQLAMDSSGNLYGTTPNVGPSGSQGRGTVFKIGNSPGWPFTVLHDFGNGTNGGSPVTGVVFGPGGLLYGVTGDFGDQTAAESGTLFSVSPAGDQVEFSVLHTFGKKNFGQSGDGFLPVGLQSIPGNAFIGACQQTYPPTDRGNLFMQQVTTGGQNPYEIAYTFNPSPDVNFPTMPPLPGTGTYSGAYFGLGSSAGANGYGGVYMLTPKVGGGFVESVIYNFDVSFGHLDTYSYIIQANAAGLLIGASSSGGKYGQGTLFEIDPPTSIGGAWTGKVDINFNDNDASLGGTPQGPLLKVGHRIYGVLSYTKTGYGAVYMITP